MASGPSPASGGPRRLAGIAAGALLVGACAAAIAIGLVGVGRGDGKRARQVAPAAATGARATDAQPAASLCPEGKTYAECHPTAGTFVPDGTRLAGCGTDQACYEKAFGNLAYRQGPQRALAVFAKAIATNRTVAADCHRMAHLIGAGALARFGGDVARAFSLGAPTCWSGYYHGILERAFTDVGSTADLGRVSRRLCAGVKRSETIWIVYQCVHGLGHGLMIYASYDLPFALSICAKLATSWDQQSCGGGVFMENIVSSYGTQSRWLKRSDTLFPCNTRTVAERWKHYCYAMATSWIGQVNGFDWPKTAATCRRAERSWVATCFQSMGRDASGQTTEDPDAVLRICRTAGTRFADCYWGAVKDFTAAFAGGRQAAALCLKGPELLRTQCFWQIGTILGTMSSTDDARRAACRAISRRYAEDCAQGAGAATQSSVSRQALAK